MNANAWKNLVTASGNWWEKQENESTIQHWKIIQANKNINSKITSESILNFVLGANDLSTKDSYDEEEDLTPLWFVEVPTYINHGDKNLKIRFNNAIMRNKKLLGYPVETEDKKIAYHKIERIVVSIRTQWLQDVTFDHIFVPDSQSEWEAARKGNDELWLKDIYIFGLGDYTSKKDTVELSCNVSLYFSNKNTEPDIKTTTKDIVIPIYRKNRLQFIQKYKNNHESALTMLVALASVFSSVYVAISSDEFHRFEESILPVIPSNWLLTGLGIFGGFLVIIIIVALMFLLKDINKNNRKQKVQDF